MKQNIQDKLGVDNIGQRIAIPESGMLAKIEAALVAGARQYCEKDYQEIIIPHITKATGACENFNTLFDTDMFEDTAYLNQTGQLLLEAFMDRFEKTYCVGPSFRKENKADPRHLAEFTLFEIEVANMPLKELQKEISNIVKHMLTKAWYECSNELQYLLGMDETELLKHLNILMPVDNKPYRSITYRGALELLEDYGLEFGADLKAEHEQELVERTGGRPIFVTHYPQEIKFFNMRVDREDPSIVASMDLLMPISGEAVGAAEREEDYLKLIERLETSDMLQLLINAIRNENCLNDHDITYEELHDEAMSRFDWYMEIIKNNPVKHSGCGIGVSRIAQSLLNVKDIRLAIAFPINRDTLF